MAQFVLNPIGASVRAHPARDEIAFQASEFQSFTSFGTVFAFLRPKPDRRGEKSPAPLLKGTRWSYGYGASD